jgi:hypothetical protein
MALILVVPSVVISDLAPDHLVDHATMNPFEPDAVYCSIPYRVLPDNSIEAMLSGGLVKFKNLDQFLASFASSSDDANGVHSIGSYDVPGNTNNRNVNIPATTGPLDYYSILLEAIKTTKQDSAQLRALVYERARFNLKRDVLFGYSSMGLADLVRQINEFELAVARVEANAAGDRASQSSREQAELLDSAPATSSNEVQILPPRPMIPVYARPSPIQHTDNFKHAMRSEVFRQYARFENKFLGFALLGMAFIGVVIITAILWLSPKVSPQIEIANKVPQTREMAVKSGGLSEDATSTDHSPKVPYPLPTTFGVYVLSNNNLTELETLPINIPDLRIALSAEIVKPSTTTISDSRPAFILFRRDLQNNAPQKLNLRVIARVTQETKIVGGKATITNIEGSWRIRNISSELKISPIPGEREMVIARIDDDVSLAAGRYALVINRIGYDFTIKGPVQSLAFCLEQFEAANGSVFTQCRAP